MPHLMDQRYDPWLVLVSVVVATLASYVPARRGTRIAPTEALRAE